MPVQFFIGNVEDSIQNWGYIQQLGSLLLGLVFSFPIPVIAQGAHWK